MGSVVWYPGAHAGRPSGALFLPARLWGSVARPVPFHFWLGVSCLVTSVDVAWGGSSGRGWGGCWMGSWSPWSVGGGGVWGWGLVWLLGGWSIFPVVDTKHG